MREHPLRLMIVDDHPVVRDGLRGIFDGVPGIEVVAEAGDGHEALAQARATEPDVVLMDLRMPGLDGVGAIERLAADHPRIRVVVLTTYDTDADVSRALAAGVAGYLLKDAPREELQAAVRTAAAGGRVLAQRITSQLIDGLGRKPAAAPTPRELEVLRLIARGAANKEVARALLISETTVKTHLKHVFAKLGVDNRAAAVVAAMERRLI
ncbi:response regulator [Nonomuraea gerenzanensis]|uniref:Two-component system response regulator n=1 Tax=Nonomuraea gerenzanensis TaxID=93944 RepID=A0A1M4EJR2_9ACTN|nr:response regulator transcription factor [Nonomuraea gerenzanensis]UBU10699.1 response regulator transcription factor [Nonomuraea gerenzanensis]SBO99121.1 two-component system response regulator [Nonomuraea gerenzanensis]